MKIEIGESLVYSFLRHQKKCLVTQLNWKTSGNWEVPEETSEKISQEFERINQHPDFSNIFRSSLDQTIKQAEIDVLGINGDGDLYAYEVAFHENGLQYGGADQTRDRVIKKLLRGMLTLMRYFPGRRYTIALCSPAVNPATDNTIKEYFEILSRDFAREDIVFKYYANAVFYEEIVKSTLGVISSEADSSELFARSAKLLELSRSRAQIQPHIEAPPPVRQAAFEDDETFAGRVVNINGVEVPLSKPDNKSFQDYVKLVMHLLLDKHLLSHDQLEKLKDREYSRDTFLLQFPLLRDMADGYQDDLGHGRYWSREIFDNQYYVCSQWWRENHPEHMRAIREWLMSLGGE